MASINLQQLAGCLAARVRICSLDRAEPVFFFFFPAHVGLMICFGGCFT